MGYKNLTICGKTDGFGCQLNAVFSGVAFCENVKGYRYVHTPFSNVSHGYRNLATKINEFIGIPNMRHGKKIHVVCQYMNAVFSNPSVFYTNSVLEKIRNWFWSNKTKTNTDIVIHIRRGDVQLDKGGDRTRRFITNLWYNIRLPPIISQYPDDYKITIHSEGNINQFDSITEGWSNSIKDRIIWKLGEDDNPECEHNMLSAFHDMCSAKVLIQSKSGLSYTSGIINDSIVYFKTGSKAIGQRSPISNWNLLI